MNHINVRTTSHKTQLFPFNTANKFRVNLMKNLKFFDGTSKVAVTSIILWNEFKNNPDLNLKHTVKTNIEQSDGKKKRKVFEFEIEDTIVDSEKVIIDFIKKTKDIMRITVNENKLRLFARKDLIALTVCGLNLDQIALQP